MKEVLEVPSVENSEDQKSPLAQLERGDILTTIRELSIRFRLIIGFFGFFTGMPKIALAESPEISQYPPELEFNCEVQKTGSSEYMLHEINPGSKPPDLVPEITIKTIVKEKKYDYTGWRVVGENEVPWFMVNLTKGNAGNKDYIKYSLELPIILDAPSRCIFKRKIPAVSENEEEKLKEAKEEENLKKTLRKRAAINIHAAQYLTDAEKEMWLKRFENESLTYKDLCKLDERFLIEEQKRSKIRKNVERNSDEHPTSITEETYENFNPEQLLQHLLLKYSRQTGLTNKQAILEKIAFDEDDAKLSILLLEETGKYDEAADLLTFYFQINPSLLDRSKPFMLIAFELQRKHGARSAWDYYRNRQREKEWAQKWERILKVAIPAIAIGVAIKVDADERRREEEKKADEERRRAEEEARQRQAARNAENERRARLGLPSVEEEEAREREEFIARCLEQCTTRYHECLGYISTDRKYRASDINKCERSYAECRSWCR